jgi:hypothetical protein
MLRRASVKEGQRSNTTMENIYISSSSVLGFEPFFFFFYVLLMLSSPSDTFDASPIYTKTIYQGKL